MNYSKRKKIKIKKKNFTIFILIILFFNLFIFLGIKWLIALTNSLETKQTPKTHEKQKQKPKSKQKKKQEENEFTKVKTEIDYYNSDYEDRYQKYHQKNKDLSTIQVIKDVNMNLDLKAYEDAEEAKNTNSNTILVNKYYKLSDNYVPKNLESINTKYALSGMKLVKEAKEAFEDLSKAAQKQDLNIIAMSSYRSYSYQVNLYNRYAKKDGKDKADTYSGRPGYSEHQTGLAIDVYNKKEDYTNFEKTEEYKWMQKHAHEYGFILRFPKNKEKETLYEFEAWHYRYVGKEIASYIKNNDISYEEYYATKIKDW